MKFKTAKMDAFAKVATAFVFLVILILTFTLMFIRFDWWLTFSATVLILCVLFSYLLIPSIFLDKEKLIIKNFFIKTEIPINSKTKIHKILDPSGYGSLRTLGIGGVFGYFGYFNGKEIWYVTNNKKAIKIVSNKKTYIISPENTELFLKEIGKLK